MFFLLILAFFVQGCMTAFTPRKLFIYITRTLRSLIKAWVDSASSGFLVVNWGVTVFITLKILFHLQARLYRTDSRKIWSKTSFFSISMFAIFTSFISILKNAVCSSFMAVNNKKMLSIFVSLHILAFKIRSLSFMFFAILRSIFAMGNPSATNLYRFNDCFAFLPQYFVQPSSSLNYSIFFSFFLFLTIYLLGRVKLVRSLIVWVLFSMGYISILFAKFSWVCFLIFSAEEL